MTRVRLFSTQRPIGFLTLDKAGHRLRPDGLLESDWIDAIRRDLARGQVAGLIGPYRWYRQATVFCPIDAAKPCPCDESVCPVDATP
jgi:hypothetical protein